MPAANTAGHAFFVDESALGLGKGMAALRRDTIHAGHAAIPEVPLGSNDVDWMAVVAARQLIAIGRDKRVRSRPAERQRIIDSGHRYMDRRQARRVELGLDAPADAPLGRSGGTR